LEEREDLQLFEKLRGVREVVHIDRDEQLALRNWLLFCCREVLSIVPANTVERGQKRQKVVDLVKIYSTHTSCEVLEAN
jgi:hypothetical protein